MGELVDDKAKGVGVCGDVVEGEQEDVVLRIATQEGEADGGLLIYIKRSVGFFFYK